MSYEKRQLVVATLQDPAWQNQSDRSVSEHLGVDHKTVGRIRRELESTGELPGNSALVGSDGRTFRRVPATNPDAPCRGCGLLPSVGCTCPSKDPDAPPSFGPPDGEQPLDDDKQWWPCPMSGCGQLFARKSATEIGWVARGFCGDCEAGKGADADG